MRSHQDPEAPTPDLPRFASRPVAMVTGGLLILGLAGACGAQPHAGPGGTPRAGVSELEAHGAEVCPEQLPRGDDPGYGFGTNEPAESAPTLPPIDEAWICRYEAQESGPAPDGEGTAYVWVRDGRPRRVEAADLPALERALDSLTPAARDRMCTADLGPRWMLAYATAEGDLTGVVVDGFGCGDVRLTDEPFVTAPGDSAQSLEPGVLATPGLRAELEAAYGTRR